MSKRRSDTPARFSIRFTKVLVCRETGRRYHIDPAWRIAVSFANGSPGFFLACQRVDIPFVRRQDATRAVRALIDAGLCTRKALFNAGIQRLRQVALEALAW